MSALVMHRERAWRAGGWKGLVTCDDGYTEGLAVADMLEGKDRRGIFFPVVSAIGGTPSWNVRVEAYRGAELMHMGHLRDLVARGHEIGCHTMTHLRPENMNFSMVQREYIDAKRALEDILGVRVTQFAYPYGYADDEFEVWAKAAGFTSAFCSPEYAGSARSPLRQPRFKP